MGIYYTIPLEEIWSLSLNQIRGFNILQEKIPRWFLSEEPEWSVTDVNFLQIRSDRYWEQLLFDSSGIRVFYERIPTVGIFPTVSWEKSKQKISFIFAQDEIFFGGSWTGLVMQEYEFLEDPEEMSLCNPITIRERAYREEYWTQKFRRFVRDPRGFSDPKMLVDFMVASLDKKGYDTIHIELERAEYGGGL